MHMNGETVIMSFKGKSCMKWAVGLNINESVNNWMEPWGLSASHLGAIHMCIIIIIVKPLLS